MSYSRSMQHMPDDDVDSLKSSNLGVQSTRYWTNIANSVSGHSCLQKLCHLNCFVLWASWRQVTCDDVLGLFQTLPPTRTFKEIQPELLFQEGHSTEYDGLTQGMITMVTSSAVPPSPKVMHPSEYTPIRWCYQERVASGASTKQWLLSAKQ